jgi:hypothetical protein
VPVVVRIRDEGVVPAVVGCDDGSGRRRATSTVTVTVPGEVGTSCLVSSERARREQDRDTCLMWSGASMTTTGERRAVAGRVVAVVGCGGRRAEAEAQSRGFISRPRDRSTRIKYGVVCAMFVDLFWLDTVVQLLWYPGVARPVLDWLRCWSFTLPPLPGPPCSHLCRRGLPLLLVMAC